jgi:FkbM family methyltransferase
MVQLPRGVRMLCYSDNTVASQIWYFGPYTEYDELLFMTRYLRPGDGVIDVGANIGLYSLLAAPIVGTEGRVDAFEPGEVAAERFARNVALNAFSQVYLHRSACSDSAGEVRFLTGWDGSNSIVPGGESPTESVLIATTTLDESLPERGYAYAKLDIEGAEGLALEGAKRLLADHNPPVWQVEAYDHMLTKFGSSMADITALFRKYGYLMADYDADTNSLVRREPTADDKNLLAIAEDNWGYVMERLSPPQRPRGVDS